jgi:hypothetical protein
MEKQFSERQLIRWAIPGWITFFLAGTVAFIHIRLNEDLWSTFGEYLNQGSGLSQMAAIVGAAVIAGFALGFILFQIYFFIYWRFNCLNTSIDNQQILLYAQHNKWSKPLFGVTNQDITNRQQADSYVTAAWLLSLSKQDKDKNLWEDRNQFLFSVYHSLGSIIIGIILTLITYIISVLLTGDFIWYSTVVNVGVLLILGVILFVARKDTGFTIQKLEEHGLYHFLQQNMNIPSQSTHTGNPGKKPFKDKKK